MTMTEAQLWALFTTKGTAYIILRDGQRGIVQTMLREDGSGRSFMLGVLLPNGHELDVYVRTID